MHDVRYRLIRRVEGDLVLLVVQDVRLSVDNVMPLCLHSVRLPLTGRDVEDLQCSLYSQLAGVDLLPIA